MKSLSDNLMTFVLVLVLGLSPLQTIAASVSKCMNMSSMHHQMNVSDNVTQTDMNKSDSKPDCCNKNECGTTHCASATVAAITSNNSSEITYLGTNTYQKISVSLTSFYPSSLYRPPKI